MGTGNFWNKNASKVFAVLMSYESPVLDDEGNETEETEMVQCEDFEYDDLIDEIKEALKASKFNPWVPAKPVWDNERQFCGRTIGELSKEEFFGDVSISVTIECVLRSAYYEGANLDWNMSVSIDDYKMDYDDIDDFKDSFINGYSDMNKGLRTMLAPKDLYFNQYAIKYSCKIQQWRNNLRKSIIS
jgi:hypothetical protein